eukprot:TRINITY_DN28034_c0_g1_i2.p1 TRINITY_DN28034_c0_g1~~TRINITY_DN28034_c0_g1_i2.p1  ORF type:complete len:163 (+),score=45.33 TRINITY_DN28034_c0_g1_i2:3-491(+)
MYGCVVVVACVFFCFVNGLFVFLFFFFFFQAEDGIRDVERSRGLGDVYKRQNYDIPKNPTTYVHRVGRTARAGKSGLSVSLATQFDIQIMISIEKFINKTLEEHKVKDDAVLELVKPVSKAMKVVKIEMSESGITELFDSRKRPKPKTIPESEPVMKKHKEN